jgi:hypothetical protein
VKPYETGLSAQRTRLAWRRTAMSGAVVTLLAARPAAGDDAGPVDLVVAAIAMAGWLALVAVAYRRRRGLNARPPLPGHRTLLLYALLTVGFGVLGVAGILYRALSPGGSVP